MTQRTDQQNKALHKYFRMLAEALQDADYDMRELKVDIRPTEELVKKYMWKPVQEALYDKKSTTDLSISEVSEVYDHLNRALIDKLSIHVPFPSEDNDDHHSN